MGEISFLCGFENLLKNTYSDLKVLKGFQTHTEMRNSLEKFLKLLFYLRHTRDNFEFNTFSAIMPTTIIETSFENFIKYNTMAEY